MRVEELRRILESVREGGLDVAAAVERLRDLPYEDLGFAQIDHHRALRLGLPEVVLAEGKTPAQVAEIMAGVAGRPTLAVPTSVGYGASFGGLAALLAMLNSCAAGVAVVNIDNGFGAGFFAHMVARRWPGGTAPPSIGAPGETTPPSIGGP